MRSVSSTLRRVKIPSSPMPSRGGRTGVAPDGHGLVLHAHVDAEALPERLGRLHQQLGAVFDDATDVVRQADGRPQLAYEMYFPFSSRMMSAASSTLLSRAAAVAPPATPPIIRYFITFLVVGFSRFLLLGFSLLFSVSRCKEKHNFRENIISNGKFIRKDIIFFWKALFCGEESTVLRAGKRCFAERGAISPPVRGGRRRIVSTCTGMCLSVQGRWLHEVDAREPCLSPISGELSNYKLRITDYS